MQDPGKNEIDWLWHSFLNGDDRSFSAIYQQNIEPLFSYGVKLCRDRELIRDCIQEVFIDLFLKRQKKIKEINKLRPYLFMAFRNCLIKKIAKNRRQESNPAGSSEENIFFHIEYSVQDQLIANEIAFEIREKLQNSIHNLAPRQKEIIYLKFEEGMEYSEIAGILKISVESARKLLYRALMTLREKIDPSVMQIFFLLFFKKFQKSCPCFIPVRTHN